MWLLIDVETIPRPDCAEFVKAKRNLKDESKIAADIADKVAMAATDIDLALPACIGVWFPDEDAPECWWINDHVPDAYVPTNFIAVAEREALETIWQYLVAHNTTKIGGFHLAFDVLLLLRRSQMLGVHAPNLDVNRYRPHRCDDLMQRLTFKGELAPKPLKTYTRLFGLDGTDDDLEGSDVPAAIAAGEYKRVERHCLADLRQTKALFERLEPTVEGPF